MSPMDVVQIVNDANKILPAGDVRIGPRDYNIYSNSQLPNVAEMNDVPLKAIGNGVLRFADVGHAEDSSAIQYNIVRVDGQKSVYLPILKQGGNSNTIQIVNGVREDCGRQRASRRRHRTRAYGNHDPGVPGISARDHLGAVVHPDLVSGCLSIVKRHRQHH